MNLDQIALRITNPNSCIATETPVLQELAEKYPYAQVFSILYLKSLSLQNDIGFDEALQKHAYRITDRMKLYDLIHDHETEVISTDAAPMETVEILQNEVELEIPEETIAPISETAEQSIETENQITAEEDDLLQEISSEILFEKGFIDEKREIESKIAINPGVEVIQNGEIWGETDSEKIALEDIDEDPVLNEISQEIVAEFQLLTPEIEGETKGESEEITAADESPINAENDLPELNLEIISEIVETIYSDNLAQTIQDIEVVEKKSEINPALEINPEIEIENSKMSFTSWLKSGNNSPTPAPTVENKKEEVKTQSIDKQKTTLIDDFINTEPRISKVKKEFYSPSKKAKESISTEGLIYSETLAEIFAMQGNFPKAITAYQQLMLTNPEKKIFFAKRIEELKEKLNT